MAQDPTTDAGSNDSRRRVIKTPIVTGWNGSGQASNQLINNVGLAQHQIWWNSTGATAGTLTISVRAAKSNVFVPIATINIATNSNGCALIAGIIDAVSLQFSGLTGTLNLNAGVNSVGISFTPTGNRSLVDRRRFQVMEVASGWNGAAAITLLAPDHAGYSQHQIAVSGGVGTVSVWGRPVGSQAFVSINSDVTNIPAGGALLIFPGMYDAFMLVPTAGLTGSINASIISIGEEMFLPVTKWQLEQNLAAAISEVIGTLVNSFNGRTGAVVLNSTDVTNALGYTPANPATFLSSFKNKLINPRFLVAQRGSSLAVGSSFNDYACIDRWRTFTSGSSATVSQQVFTPGQGVVPYEPEAYMRHVVTSVAGANNGCCVTQFIEDVRTLAGQTATVSFWAKADANKNIAVEFGQYFNQSGGGSAPVNAIGSQLVALTTAWQKITVTVNIPSISGKTVVDGGTNGLAVTFWFDAGSSFATRAANLGQQSGTFDIADAQVEPGSIATPLEIRHIEIESGMCLRYFMKLKSFSAFGIYAFGMWGSTTQANLSIPTPVSMRTAPTIASSGLFAVWNGSGGISVTGFSLSVAYLNFISLAATVASGGTVGATAQLFSNNDATAFITFNAEI